MARLVPLMRMPLHHRMAPWIYATDAEGDNNFDNGGYGIVACECAEELAERTWLTGARPGHTVCRLDGRISHLTSGEKELESRIPVSRVPQEILQQHHANWQAIAWGRWSYADHIMLGEGRAVVGLMERLAACSRAHQCCVTSLMDNESWSGAHCKGRSPAPAVNFLLRRLGSVTLAADILLTLPWVDTKNQPADRLSRLRGI